MAETPEERLARLRREVESSWTPPAQPHPDTPPDLGVSAPPAPATAPAAADAGPVPASPDPDPDPAPRTVEPPAPIAAPEPVPSAPDPAPPPPSRSPSPAPRPDPVPAPPPPRPAPAPAERSAASALGREGDDWSLADALGGASLGQWVAIGLVVIGGYLLLAQLFPWVSFPGSLVMTVAGVVLLWQHFGHRAGPWALYAGAVLAAIGAVRVLGDIAPFPVQGETSLGLGIALVGIGYLRHTQAGGWGWQGWAGGIALAWGLIQLATGFLPGAPGILDLVVPILILGGGLWLLLRTFGGGHKNG